MLVITNHGVPLTVNIMKMLGSCVYHKDVSFNCLNCEGYRSHGRDRILI